MVSNTRLHIPLSESDNIAFVLPTTAPLTVWRWAIWGSRNADLRTYKTVAAARGSNKDCGAPGNRRTGVGQSPDNDDA